MPALPRVTPLRGLMRTTLGRGYSAISSAFGWVAVERDAFEEFDGAESESVRDSDQRLESGYVPVVFEVVQERDRQRSRDAEVGQRHAALLAECPEVLPKRDHTKDGSGEY